MLLLNPVEQRVQIRLRSSVKNVAIAVSAFFHTKAQIRWDQRLYPIKEQIVEFRTRLAADFDCVFKTGCGDQGHPGSLALQQGVGANGGAMQKYGRSSQSDFF